MSATYTSAASVLKTVEGGYCRGGMSCGSTASGETYRGIDRKHQPNWPGWKLIDAYKKQYGEPRHLSFITGTMGAAIDREVEIFYTKWWNQYGFNLITNTNLAALLYTWSVQGPNRAMRYVNEIAQSLGAKTISASRISPNVAAVINANVSNAYMQARNKIITWYKENTGAKANTFIANRVNIFPASISTVKAAPAYGMASAAPNLFSWLRKIFDVSTISR